jgi:hypothetical protein
MYLDALDVAAVLVGLEGCEILLDTVAMSLDGFVVVDEAAEACAFDWLELLSAGHDTGTVVTATVLAVPGGMKPEATVSLLCAVPLTCVGITVCTLGAFCSMLATDRIQAAASWA